MANKIQLRRDTAANWTTANPVLAQGEPGVEVDTSRAKYGDGVKNWQALPYAEEGPFLQAGAGAKPRSISDKLKDLVSVKDFGAVGNGVADDTNAFKAAVAAHRRVYVPYGIYKITSTIQLAESYSAIIGDARLPIIRYHNPGSGPAIEVTATPGGSYNEHSRVENLIIEARDPSTGAYWYPTYSPVPKLEEAGVAFQATAYGANAVQRCLARNLRIFNFSVGVWNHNTVDQRLDDLRIQVNAIIPNGTYAATNKCIGIFCNGTPGGGMSPNASITITNCTNGMKGAPEIATSIGLYAEGTDLRDIWASDCVFSDGDYGVRMVGKAGPTDKYMDIHLHRIISDQVNVAAISLTGLTGSGSVSIIGGYGVLTSKAVDSACIKIDNCKGVGVSGGYQALGLALNTSDDKGVFINNSSCVSVAEALIQNCFTGIALSNSKYCSLVGNVISADLSYESNPTLTNGIQLVAGSSYNTIAGNAVSGGDATHKYVTGISLAATCLHNVVTGNQFDHGTVTTPANIAEHENHWIGPAAATGALMLHGPAAGVEIWVGTGKPFTATERNWIMKDMPETDGTNCIHIRNGIEPTTAPTLGGVLYTQGGQLRYKGTSGTVTTIAPA